MVNVRIAVKMLHFRGNVKIAVCALFVKCIDLKSFSTHFPLQELHELSKKQSTKNHEIVFTNNYLFTATLSELKLYEESGERERDLNNECKIHGRKRYIKFIRT